MVYNVVISGSLLRIRSTGGRSRDTWTPSPHVLRCGVLTEVGRIRGISLASHGTTAIPVGRTVLTLSPAGGFAIHLRTWEEVVVGSSPSMPGPMPIRPGTSGGETLENSCESFQIATQSRIVPQGQSKGIADETGQISKNDFNEFDKGREECQKDSCRLQRLCSCRNMCLVSQ